jgi:hypothetical protein
VDGFQFVSEVASQPPAREIRDAQLVIGAWPLALGVQSHHLPFDTSLAVKDKHLAV